MPSTKDEDVTDQVLKTFNRLIRDPKNMSVNLDIRNGNVEIVATQTNGTRVRHGKIPKDCRLCALLRKPLDGTK